MLGMWLVYALVVPATFLGGLLVSKRGRRMLKKVRRRQFDRSVKASRSAIKARKDAKLRTARGQLKAQRKAEPYRLGFGHRRAEGDETRTRKAVGTAKEKVGTKAREYWYRHKVNRANRKAQWVPENTARTVPQYQGVGTGDSTKASTSTGTTCKAKTQRGTPCRNQVLANGRCHFHKGWVG